MEHRLRSSQDLSGTGSRGSIIVEQQLCVLLGRKETGRNRVDTDMIFRPFIGKAFRHHIDARLARIIHRLTLRRPGQPAPEPETDGGRLARGSLPLTPAQAGTGVQAWLEIP